MDQAPSDVPGQFEEPVQFQFVIPPFTDTPLEFANLIATNQDGSTFFLIFAQAQPPVVGSLGEAQAVMASGPQPATILGKYAVPAEAFQQFLASAANQWNAFAKQNGLIDQHLRFGPGEDE